MFEDVKRVPVSWIAGVVAADIALTWVVVAVVFPSGALDSVSRSTAGLLNPTWTANLVLLAVVVGGLMFGLCRLPPRAVGLRWEDLLTGLLGAAAFWGAVQLILLLHTLGSGRQLAWNPSWSGAGAAAISGALLAQLLGSALREEIVYRGFLVPQLHRHLHSRFPSSRAVVILAVLGAALVFAAMHVPNVLRLGIAPAPQFLIHTFSGVIFGLLYVFTGNLVFVVGVHALGNWGMPLVDASIDPSLVTFLLRIVLAAVLGAVFLRRRPRPREAAMA